MSSKVQSKKPLSKFPQCKKSPSEMTQDLDNLAKQKMQQMKNMIEEAERKKVELEQEMKNMIEEAERKKVELQQEILELEQKKKDIETAHTELEKQTLEKAIAKFFDDNKLFVAEPITWKDATETGTSVQLYSKYVDLPENCHNVEVVTIPVVHFCNECKKVTKQMFVSCKFPLDYHSDRTSLDHKVLIHKDQLKCLDCMFASAVHHVKGFEIAKHMV